MFKLSRKDLDVYAGRQQRIVQGKEKFLNHLRCIPVHKDKVQALQAYMIQPMVDTAFGTADMYITLWTSRITYPQAKEYFENGMFSVPVLLTCHFHDNKDKWYYAINREFFLHDPDIPVLVRAYMHRTLQTVVESHNSLSWRASTRSRDYHALVPCFEEIKNLLFGSLGHRVVHIAHAKVSDNSMHPAGDYISSAPSSICDISYDEVQPVIGDDVLFNAKMMGTTDSDLFTILERALYCNTNGGEVYYRSMDERFWRNCSRKL